MIYDLEDTIVFMESQDYRDRFIAEYNQLKLRRKKLYKMLVKYKHDMLDFEPSCSFDLLNAQYNSMTTYMEILQQRSILEGIDLTGLGDV